MILTILRLIDCSVMTPFDAYGRLHNVKSIVGAFFPRNHLAHTVGEFALVFPLGSIPYLESNSICACYSYELRD